MEVYSFLIRNIKGNKEEAEKLSKALRPFGINVRYDRTSFMGSNDYSKLTLVFDEEDLEKKRTRNAGIKVRYTENAYEETIGTIKLRLEKETHEQVAKSLGMSRMTLYRKLKKAEVNNLKDDEPFYLL